MNDKYPRTEFHSMRLAKKMGAMTISNKPVGQYYKLMTGRKMKMQKVNIKWKTITQQNACRLLQRLSLNLQIKKMPKILT